ncbi:hypothetical protein FKG94_20150 [Exilibacterium tricleocarpae]|uniref:DUF5666 domain-containing protein n=1 Tax=Exilibacterium tricleocarpae TaxID=2591008 RepID=A0A545T1X5_9GAMM|nr:hypothetical protein [Exilibacterium tricleocarpae]TQV71199.1 hypothetical protein FKG94_20150 [Exilibacterium tricleocarpae]
MVAKLREFAVLVFILATAVIPFARADEVAMVPFGIVDRVDYDKENALVIDDRYYRMALNMVVKDRRGATVTRFALKQGQKVRFRVMTNAGGTRQVDQIWILPDRTERPEED